MAQRRLRSRLQTESFLGSGEDPKGICEVHWINSEIG